MADPEHLGDQFSAFGIDPEAVAAAVDSEAGKMQFGVHADNWTLLGVFLAMQTQWRVAVGLSGVMYLGIDYAALPPVMEMLGIPRAKHAETFAAVRLMESAALNVRNASREVG